MSEREDQAWFDALTREDSVDGTGVSAEGRALRKAILAGEQPSQRSAAALDEDIAALERRLETEGLLEPSTAAVPEWLVSNRGAWAVAASLVLMAIALPMAWDAWRVQERIFDEPLEILRDAPAAMVPVEHPRVEAQRLGRLLERTGAEVAIYEAQTPVTVAGGAQRPWIVDAMLSVPVTEQARAALNRHGIAAPADGRLRVAFIKTPE